MLPLSASELARAFSALPPPHDRQAGLQKAAASCRTPKRLRRTHFHGSGWIHLLGQRAVEGAGVFDLQIIAAMLANAVQRIYTFNPGDFQVFAELTAVTPT